MKIQFINSILEKHPYYKRLDSKKRILCINNALNHLKPQVVLYPSNYKQIQINLPLYKTKSNFYLNKFSLSELKILYKVALNKIKNVKYTTYLYSNAILEVIYRSINSTKISHNEKVLWKTLRSFATTTVNYFINAISQIHSTITTNLSYKFVKIKTIEYRSNVNAQIKYAISSVLTKALTSLQLSYTEIKKLFIDLDSFTTTALSYIDTIRILREIKSIAFTSIEYTNRIETIEIETNTTTELTYLTQGV